MTTYTLSLSRWHKVAERLARKHLELTQAAKNVFLNTQVSGYLGEGQVARLQSDGARALADIQKAFQVQDGVMAIRQAIGDANARVGVATLLAQHDAMSRRQKLLEAILAGQGSEMVSVEELAHLPSQVVSEDRYDRSRGQVRVRILDGSAQTELKREAAVLLAKVYALADQISDLNRERVQVELSEEVAAIGGL